jgi:hypothetical protein
MRRQRRFRSEHGTLGTLQNPEAHRNGISKEEYDAIRRVTKDHSDPKQTLETLKHWADILESSPPGTAPSAPEPAADAPATDAPTTPPSESSAASVPQDSAPAVTARIPRPRRARPVATRKRAKHPAVGAMARLGISAEVPELERHARKCAVCKHKEREDIELDFLHWHNAVDIMCAYDLPDKRILFRHAHATGLFERRMLDMRFAASLMVDQAETVKPSATAVLKAMRACTILSNHGAWIDPPTRVVHYAGAGDPFVVNVPINVSASASAKNVAQDRPQLPAATPATESPEKSEDDASDDDISNPGAAIRNRYN